MSQFCNLCVAGFPVENGLHVPTQALGMIPVTRCKAIYKPMKIHGVTITPEQEAAMVQATRSTVFNTRDVIEAGAAAGIPRETKVPNRMFGLPTAMRAGEAIVQRERKAKRIMRVPMTTTWKPL